MPSKLERTLEFQLKALGIHNFEREYRFHPERKWRLDFYFPKAKLGVEVDGGIYGQGDKAGRHNRGVGMEADNKKLNACVGRGIAVLRFGPKAVRSGEAAGEIEANLNDRLGGDAA